jgi:tyrosinase
LYWFEQYLRDQDNTLGIPWWDWTSNTSRQIGIPSAFSSPNTENNQRNALYSSHINVPSANPSIDRDTFRSPGNPGDLPTPDVLASLLQITDFLQFSSSLETYPHNFIHGWVGGDMGLIAYSAYDPIFYSHHCMIDRIWYLWQLQHGNSTIPPDLLSQPLAPFNLTGAAVLRVEDLGYEYVVDQVTVISGK